ncbi:MAG: sigma 54-interacting transcriptional regulator [Pirellulales bacterium]|nr:sigma 54-interacting transcriptional regulator [Pirellulales bacterium]
MDSNSLRQRDQTVLQRLEAPPALTPLANELLWSAATSDEPSSFLGGAVARILSFVGGDYVALTATVGGRWHIEADAGDLRPLPIDLLADVLDREAPCTREHWAAAPLAPREASGRVLLTYSTDLARALSAVERLGPLLQMALSAVRLRHHHVRRVCRLEAILEITNQWNRTHEVEPLLAKMAEAATRLLDADRASIFLWDRPNHLLVGRPALGVENGELRIPDNRGVVGQVIQTGEPRRVDAAADPEQIDRDVDAQLAYETNTLLCVPLRGSRDELFGAFEVINKRSGGFKDEDEDALVELAGHAAVALENAQDRQKLLSANRQIAEQAAEGVRLIGDSPAIEALRSIIRRVADTDLAVLILGENGTGKEVVAQSVHYLSHRSSQPFIAVNCAAIPEALAESELFGHEKGAFTDAREARSGKFELAAGGTLFLDEIGDLSLACQAKLLRVLEEKVLVRVGGSTPVHSDARVLAATNQDLTEMVRRKQFREDLYFRLNVVTLELPPLRDRPGDVLLLAEHFLSDFCRKARRRVPKFHPAAQKRLADHAWPGNVRELRNLMERIAYLSTADQVQAEDLAFILSPCGDARPVARVDATLSEATARFQVEYIEHAIEQSDGNLSRAAGALGLHRSNLYRKMRQLRISSA